MDYSSVSLEKHYQWKGKIKIEKNAPVSTMEDLALAYTPGVARPCLEIQKDPSLSYDLTRRWNTVAIVTDGSAVLGLGNIGGLAGMPVMEGKALLFKQFADIDAIPLCIKSNDVDEIVRTVELLADSFGGVNLEDIAAPRCFEIETKLRERCDIPIFHDDQHGTAIVASAALQNALKLIDRKMEDISVVFSGAGAAGTAIGELLLKLGVWDITYVNRKGAICKGDMMLNYAQKALAEKTNPKMKKGSLADVIKGADVFIGVSAPNLLSVDMLKSMAPDPIIFAMANPIPEIMPDVAKAAGAAVVGTGRSDFPNQINNVLAFPGIFRGALDSRASDINDAMKLAAAKALADLVGDELSAEHILPTALDPNVAPAIAKSVAEAAVKSGVARI